MQFSFGSIVASLFVSGFGFAFFKYGRKKMRPAFVYIGIVMMVYPYVVTNPLAMIGIACLLCLLLWFLSR